MGISRIGTLFAANVDSPRKSNPQEGDRGAARSTEALHNDDAAVVSRSAYSANPVNDAERTARVQQLKNQVRRGEYRADTTKVALSLYRDLL